MGIQVLTREGEKFSPFKHALYDLMSFEGEELFICVGYAYNNILTADDEFINSIIRGFENIENPKITIMGGMYRNEEIDEEIEKRTNFSSFCEKFKEKFNEKFNSKFPNKKVSFKIIENSFNDTSWHGKVYLKLCDKQPIGMIIGSSNLSMPTLDKNYKDNYNGEVDLFIWNEDL